MNCKNCIYFVFNPQIRAASGTSQRIGECRRYPPTAIFLESSSTSFATPVADEYFCGEFKQQPTRN